MENNNRLPVGHAELDTVLQQMSLSDISCATIRQSGSIARALEEQTGEEFLHLEMGIPGLPPAHVGVQAEKAALDSGVASIYPNMMGTPELKTQASRFIKAFLDVDQPAEFCIPTVGSMQGSFTAFLLCSQIDPVKDTILFIDPGFPVQRSQTKMLGIKSESFDIYEHRGERLREKLDSYLSKGNIVAVIYSSPNNPAWFNLTDEELEIIGTLATRYDTIVIEDLAYMCMDFRKPLGRPYEAPFQPTVAKYTDNYILLMSASKIFSYAGQRIAIIAVSEAVYRREYPALKSRYNMTRFGDAYVLGVLYGASSGTSHSAQCALAQMFKAAADGDFDFVGEAGEYARRAALTKETFVRNGFHIVYERDGDEPVSDGFFYTIGYKDMTGTQLMGELMRYGICTLSLTMTGSCQHGVRICISQINRPDQFDMLADRLAAFAADHP